MLLQAGYSCASLHKTPKKSFYDRSLYLADFQNYKLHLNKSAGVQGLLNGQSEAVEFHILLCLRVA